MKIITLGNCCKKSKQNHKNAVIAAKNCGVDEPVNIGDASTLGILHTFPFSQEMNLCFSREKGSSERFYSDMILGISSKNMAIWDLPKSAENFRPMPDYPLSFAEGQNAVCAAFSRDSDFVAVAFDDGSIVLYFKLRYVKQFIQRTLESTMTGVQSLAFSPDSKLLAAASSDGSICIWNTVDCSFFGRIYSFSGMQTPVAFSADSKSIYGCTKENVVSRMLLDGSGRIVPPNLFFAEAFVPVGVEVPLGASVNFFSELSLALKVSMLMNPGVTSSEPAFSLGGRVRTGITIAKVAVTLGAEYDSMWGIIPEISLMANFKLKGKAGKVKK